MIAFSRKALSKLRKESRPRAASLQCFTSQGAGTQHPIHFSCVPARSHTITVANSKASATKQTAQQPQPLPQLDPCPPKHPNQRADTSGEGQKRGGQQYAVHALTAPPSPPACAPLPADARSSERTQTVKGRRGEDSTMQSCTLSPPPPPACAPPLADARHTTPRPPIASAGREGRGGGGRGDFIQTSGTTPPSPLSPPSPPLDARTQHGVVGCATPSLWHVRTRASVYKLSGGVPVSPSPALSPEPGGNEAPGTAALRCREKTLMSDDTKETAVW